MFDEKIIATPLTWFSRNLPLLGLATKLQCQFTDKAIERLFDVMARIRDMADSRSGNAHRSLQVSFLN